MVRNGDADKPVWATEVGWNTVPPDHPGAPIYGRVNPEQQARYTVQAYQRAQEEWPWMGVLNYWFFKRATDTETDQVFYYFRMMEPDFTPLPVYEAMKQYASVPPRVYPGYHQEDHWALRYHGDWQTVPDDQAVFGTLQVSQNPGDRLHLTFVGTDLELVVHRNAESGAVRIRVDGGRPSDMMLASEEDEYGQEVPIVKGLPTGSHQVEIENVGAPDTLVEIDGVVVGHEGRPVLLYAAALCLAVAVILYWRRRARGIGF
jgi:hypothetical protein